MLPPICIPSWRRAHTLSTKTLRWLDAEGYPPELIHIYVADVSEAATYASVCPGRQIHIGVPGYTEQLRHIQRQWPSGQMLCICHDDLHSIKYHPGGPQGLTALLQILSTRMAEERIGLAGIMPNDNGLNLSDRYTTHLAHIVGCFYLMENRRWDMMFLEVEDAERSIRYFIADGKVLRYKGAGVCTKYNACAGGLTAPDRMERKAIDVAGLEQKYPEYCTAIIKRGQPDFALNWRVKPPPQPYQEVNYII